MWLPRPAGEQLERAVWLGSLGRPGTPRGARLTPLWTGWGDTGDYPHQILGVGLGRETLVKENYYRINISCFLIKIKVSDSLRNVQIVYILHTNKFRFIERNTCLQPRHPAHRLGSNGPRMPSRLMAQFEGHLRPVAEIILATLLVARTCKLLAHQLSTHVSHYFQNFSWYMQSGLELAYKFTVTLYMTIRWWYTLGHLSKVLFHHAQGQQCLGVFSPLLIGAP